MRVVIVKLLLFKQFRTLFRGVKGGSMVLIYYYAVYLVLSTILEVCVV